MQVHNSYLHPDVQSIDWGPEDNTALPNRSLSGHRHLLKREAIIHDPGLRDAILWYNLFITILLT